MIPELWGIHILYFDIMASLHVKGGFCIERINGRSLSTKSILVFYQDCSPKKDIEDPRYSGL